MLRVVEQGIPCGVLKAQGRPSKYPFKLMQVGDSFALAAHEALLVKRAAERHRERNLPLYFRVAQDAEGQWRCWRLADRPKRGYRL